MSAGVYRLTINRGDKAPWFYIGQASDLRRRVSEHMWRLSREQCNNRRLQSTYKKYGRDAFRFETVLICQREKTALTLYEQIVLDLQIAATGAKSICNVHRQCVATPLGAVRSLQTRRRQSAALKGKKRSPAAIEAMAACRRGKPLKPEAIAKRTAKQKGRVQSPAERAKRSAIMKGRKLSPEHIAKMAASKKGKVSEAMLASLRSPETNAKRVANRRASAALRGRY